jgi:hypothetical protein
MLYCLSLLPTMLVSLVGVFAVFFELKIEDPDVTWMFAVFDSSDLGCNIA